MMPAGAVMQAHVVMLTNLAESEPFILSLCLVVPLVPPSFSAHGRQGRRRNKRNEQINAGVKKEADGEKQES
jgi:hypothetical protein